MVRLSRRQFSRILQIIGDDPQKLRQLCHAICMNLIQLEKIALAQVHIITAHLNVPTRMPMNTSVMTGQAWVNELLDGHPVRCFNALRMNRDTFLNLCHLLEHKYFINNKVFISLKERVAWLLRTLSHRCANRDTMERFQHSGSSVSDHFGDILLAIGRLGKDLIKPRDPFFRSTPTQIVESFKYYPYFQNCVGALDGCHVELTVPEKLRIRFINQKGVTSTNILAVCDFDLLFIFFCAGWEGSAHDTRVYMNAVNERSQIFHKPPPGKYYLGDKGYLDREGLMTPHTRVRYHQSEFRVENPRDGKELFNKCHSSLRSAIERSFGVLKARWQILLKIPSYSLLKQIQIVNAYFALHNFVRLSKFGDPCFNLIDSAPHFVPEEDNEESTDASNVCSSGASQTGSHEMVRLKDEITRQMMGMRRRIPV